MKFGNTNSYKSVAYPFNWLAEYDDEAFLVEYEGNKKNDFYSIDQYKLKKFGLIGQGMEFYYSEDGKLHFNNHPIEIFYKLNDKEYELTSNKDRDCISYKQAFSMFTGKNGKGLSGIESIHYGYKTIVEFEDIQFYFSPIVALPMKGKVYIEVKLTANKSVNGELIFKSNGMEIERNDVSLEVNKKDIIHWTVK